MAYLKVQPMSEEDSIVSFNAYMNVTQYLMCYDDSWGDHRVRGVSGVASNIIIVNISKKTITSAYNRTVRISERISIGSFKDGNGYHVDDATSYTYNNKNVTKYKKKDDVNYVIFSINVSGRTSASPSSGTGTQRKNNIIGAITYKITFNNDDVNIEVLSKPNNIFKLGDSGHNESDRITIETEAKLLDNSISNPVWA
jgi:hypothetical protein